MKKVDAPKKGRPKFSAVINEFARSKTDIEKRGGLPSLKKAENIWDEIWMVEAHNSTGLEGNTLPMSEVRALLTTDHAKGGKKVREYMEVIGYANAAKWVYSQAVSPKYIAAKDAIITLSEIRNIHKMLVELVWQIDPPLQLLDGEGPGSFRLHDIKRFDEGMKPPPFTDIAPQMSDFIKGANAACKRIKAGDSDAEIPAILAKIHNQFERIHPFRDGNGRCGRLVLNLILVRLGFPPCIILKSRRAQYLKGLQMADKHNFNKLAEIIAKGVLDNVHRFIVPKTMKNSELVRLESLVTKSLNYSALRQAAFRGRLQASIGEGGIYYSTKQAVEEYLSSKYKR